MSFSVYGFILERATQEASRSRGAFSHLDEGEFAEAGAALGVPDGDLAVVLDPPPPTEDVVHTRGHLVPLVVIAKPESTGRRLDGAVRSLVPRIARVVELRLKFNVIQPREVSEKLLT